MPYVALDIGHGNNTKGKGVQKGGRYYKEHDFNSRLSIVLREILEDHGFKITYGQEPHSPEVPLKQRTDYYNRENVDLVVSNHANASYNKNVEGVCAFYWYSADDSKRLAELFVGEAEKEGLCTHGNGLHPSKPNSWTNMHICRETHMTAVLFENGFMTNDKEFERIFKDPEYVTLIARIQAKAICAFFNIEYKEGSSGGSKAPEPSASLKEEWGKAVQLGITDGSNPQGTPTKEQVAAMIIRATGK